LITGGSRGIGAACALLAASQGWSVAVNYTRDAKAAETAKAKGGGTDWLANTMADNLLPVQVAEPH
jgi:NAD(P)-dependent dehydrogenase (short-subunit alcohol dehydrogenase family)